MTELHLSRDQFLELQKIGIGAFAPLTGFMNEDDFTSVVDTMRLRDGSVFSLPVYLDVTDEDAGRLRGRPRVVLLFEDREVGEIEPQSFFRWDRQHTAKKVFAVSDRAHAGVSKVLDAKDWLIGGPVKLYESGSHFLFEEELSPAQTRAEFDRRGWKTVAGFQTRNVPHRAHEYLQRVALELCDGLFIQPLLGRKKPGDYTPEAVLAGYQALIANFFPFDRVLFGILSTAMRYAGPREALFHALIRRNYGCTHFVVGRDHAGVGSYYGKYEAHALVQLFAEELGIKILALSGPFYCRHCDGIATEKTCGHFATNPAAVTEISGTLMRKLLSENTPPRPELMRAEVVAALHGVPLFIEANQT